MEAIIKKSEKLEGEVIVPGSKSYTHRVIAAASLTKDTTLVENYSRSQANIALMVACEKFGAKISREGNYLKIVGFGGNPTLKDNEMIEVGNSGTAFRLSIALAALAQKRIQIDGDPSLQGRPVKPLVDALKNMYVNISGVKRNDPKGNPNLYAPVTVNAHGLKGGLISIDGHESSQYLTSLLLISPYVNGDMEIKVNEPIVSKPYIDMTIEVLESFGVNAIKSPDYTHYSIKEGQMYHSPGTYKIPGDYSQAAFFFAAACLVKSDVTIKGLEDDKQGDIEIISILEKMGATIEKNGNDYRIQGPFNLKGIPVDLNKHPDLFPVLSVLGIYAEGEMRLYNAPHLRTKETDRIAVIEREFKKYGIKVESSDDGLTVYNTKLPEGDYVFNVQGKAGIPDHRIAMALSLIGLRNGPVTIKESNSVVISYPKYFDDLMSIGAQIEIKGQFPEYEIPPYLEL